MDVFKFSKPQLLLPPGPVCVRKRVVSQVQFFPVVFDVFKAFCSKMLNMDMSKLLDQDGFLLICECSLMKEYYNGAYHYKTTSFDLEDNVNGIILSLLVYFIKNNLYSGILLSNYEDVANIAFSHAMRHLTVLEKCNNMNAKETVVSVKQLYDGMYGHDSLNFNRMLKQSYLLQIDGICQESKYSQVYGCPVNPVREVLEDRYSFSQFTILSTNLDSDGLRDYFGERLVDCIRSKYLRINMMDESFV